MSATQSELTSVPMISHLFEPSQAAWLPIAIGAAVVARVLTLPRQGRPGPSWLTVLVAVGGVAAGLAAVVAATAVIRDLGGWPLKDDLTAERLYRPPNLEGAPVLLFVGSSFTRHGLDPALVNRRLADHGMATRVMARGAGGTSRLEQWFVIKEALEALDRTPQAVFLEVARSYDLRPAYGLRTPFSTRAISQFDLQGGLWIADALRYSGDDLKGMEAPWSVARLAAEHVFINTFNVGLLHRLADPATVRPRPSFEPRPRPEDDYDPADQRRQLAWRPGPDEFESGADDIPNGWVRGYFEDVEALLAARGIDTLGFYVPPHAAISLRRYAVPFCQYQEARGHLCLDANQSDLLDRLDSRFWIDRTHLRAPGARLYSRWLADRLIAEGVAR